MAFAMQLPNRILAVIAQEKLTDYLLNTRHRRGGTKARLLEQCGYTVQNWRQLEADIRSCLETEVDIVRTTEYGTRYEIRHDASDTSWRTLNGPNHLANRRRHGCPTTDYPLS